MSTTAAWLDCSAVGCPNGTAVTEARHIANLTAADWYCPQHTRRHGGEPDA